MAAPWKNFDLASPDFILTPRLWYKPRSWSKMVKTSFLNRSEAYHQPFRFVPHVSRCSPRLND